MGRGLRTAIVTVAAVMAAVAAVALLGAGSPAGARDAFACTGQNHHPDGIWCVPPAPGGGTP